MLVIILNIIGDGIATPPRMIEARNCVPQILALASPRDYDLGKFKASRRGQFRMRGNCPRPIRGLNATRHDGT